MQSITKVILGAGFAFVAGAAVQLAIDPIHAAGEPAAVQLAQNDQAEIIIQRQGLMKTLGDHAGAINGFVEEDKGPALDVAKRAADIQRRASELVTLFPAGTGVDDNVTETAAKMEIWQQRSEFEAAAANLGDLAGALWQAAATEDKQQIADAFGRLGRDGCGGCHQTFRVRRD
jgi:cytochrome c556